MRQLTPAQEEAMRQFPSGFNPETRELTFNLTFEEAADAILLAAVNTPFLPEGIDEKTRKVWELLGDMVAGVPTGVTLMANVGVVITDEDGSQMGVDY